MLLTSASAHAIRAMIYLASQPDQRFCRAKEISEREQIPNPFLGKILQQLRHHHLLESVRGSRGGYRLGLPSSAIRLSEIVEAIEGEMKLDHCILHEAVCERANQCSLHLRLQPALEHLRSTMGDTTLEAVSQPQPSDSSSRPPRKGRSKRKE